MFRQIGWSCVVALVLTNVGWSQNDAEKPTLVLDPGGHTSAVRGLAFSPDGKQLISCTVDHSIRFWNVESGELVRVLHLPMYGTTGALALSPNGKLLAVSLANSRKEHGIALLSLSGDDTFRHLISGDNGAAQNLAFSPDGKRLASGHNNGMGRIWDVGSGRCEQALHGHAMTIWGLAFSPDGRRLATCSIDDTGRIWGVESGKEETVLEDREVRSAGWNGLAWSPDGKTLVTGCNGIGTSMLRVWNADGTLREHHRSIAPYRSLVFTRDSRAVLFARPGGAYLYDLERKQVRAGFDNFQGEVWTVALSPDERIAATSGPGGEDLVLWRTTDGKLLHRLAGTGRSPVAAAWSPDGKYIAWGSTLERTPDWSNAYLHLRHPLERSFDLQELEFGPQPGAAWRRQQPTSGSLSVERERNLRGTLPVNVKDGAESICTIKHDWPTAFTFLPDERLAVGGGGRLKLYQARTGQLIRTFNGSAHHALAPSPDNRYLLAPQGNQTLAIWKLDSDKPLLTLFFAGNSWIAWTTEGYYAASPDGEKLMGWQTNNGDERLAVFHPAGRFRKSLYRPDVIKLTLNTGSVEQALRIADQARGARTEATEVADVLPPKIRLLAPAKDLKVRDAALEVRARASSVGTHPVTTLQLLIDGRPLKGQGEVFRVESPKLGDVEASWSIRLTPGKHRLTVRAESAVSTALSDEVEVAYLAPDPSEQSKRPSLYVLAVGISDYPDKLKLNYAAKDAQTLVKTFQEHSKTLFEKIEVKELTNHKATQREILKGIAWLGKQMTQRDVGVVFLAGHGEVAGNGAFYFLPADVDPDEIAATGVPGEQIKTMLAALPGRVMFLLDACHAGGFEKTKKRNTRALTDDLIRDLAADERGIIVMCAATGKQFALESEHHHQGMFTLALVEGLQGKAKQVEGAVYLHHLDTYVTDRVRELSRGEQSPTTARPASIRSFPLSRP